MVLLFVAGSADALASESEACLATVPEEGKIVVASIQGDKSMRWTWVRNKVVIFS